MPTETLVLIGAGGHAKVVMGALNTMGKTFAVEVRDDNPALSGQSLLECKIKTPVGPVAGLTDRIHLAIGDNEARKRLGDAILKDKKSLITIIHPRATVSASARISDGVFLAAGAIVAPDATVAHGAIINHGAIIDHDCQIEAWAHIAPGVVLGGAVHIGEGCLVGSGAVILPGLSVGEWAIIGAGAVVTKNVEAGATVVGIPAKVLKRR
jgi:sugar O-acyltransferase (sialic acid O-acetyltransferase NeuD family)